LSSPFESLGLAPTLLQTLSTLGYEEPTPIQQEAIPLLLAGRDVFGQAATGTGKTAAFALPMLQRLKLGERQAFETSALVLVPTRELAVQVAEAVHTYGKAMGVSVLPIYGGQDIGLQLRRLKHGLDVVVATPGRALDHLRRKTLKVNHVSLVVLDEADEMLDMGFADDLEAILTELPKERQTALFSATLPPRIAKIADGHLNNPARLKIRSPKAAGVAPKVRETAYFVSRGQKTAALGRVLDLEAPRSAIVFCRTRTEVDTLTDTLTGLGFRAEALHGGLNQEQRDRVLKRFKAGTTETLVATDVAARGLHVDKLSHVINFDLPASPEAYVHRIGRTGRAGQEGVAISFADPREHRLIKNIERVTGQKIAMAAVPSASDLRARKLELLQASLRETLIAGELDAFRVVVESLSAEFDVVQVAAAAVKLAMTVEGEREHAEVTPEPIPFPTSAKPREPKPAHKTKSPPRPGRAKSKFVRIFVGVGRRGGIRPGDLVGAIANEAGLSSEQIGSIQITDMYSLVEVPEEVAGRVMGALRQTTLRGRRVKVEFERPGGNT
jgi:ATP-dependent RNA helicase DeaD